MKPDDVWSRVKDLQIVISKNAGESIMRQRADADIGRFSYCNMAGASPFIRDGCSAEQAGITLLSAAGLSEVTRASVMLEPPFPEADTVLSDNTPVLIKMVSRTSGKLNWNTAQFRHSIKRVHADALIVAVSMEGNVARIIAIGSFGFLCAAKKKMGMTPRLPPPIRNQSETYWRFDVGCLECPSPFPCLL